MPLPGTDPTTILAGLSVLSAAIAGVLGVLFWQRREERGATWLAAEMAVTTLWLATFGLQLLSPNPGGATFWFRLQSISLVWIPVTWFAFVAEYTGWQSPVSGRTVAVLAAFPLVNSLVIATNGSLHTLSWTSAEVVTNGPLTLLSVTYGPAWQAGFVYSYLVIGIAFVLLWQHRQRSVHLYRRQTDLILLSSIPPGITNALFYLDLLPYPALDPTPFAFTLTGLLVFWTLFRYRLFELSPVARRSVVEDMEDAMVVLDTDGQIIDLNGSARSLIGADEPIGQHVGRAFPALAACLDDLSTSEPDDSPDGVPDSSAESGYATQTVDLDTDELVLDRDGTERVSDLRASFLRDRTGHVTGLTVVLHDVTDRERREETLTALHEAGRNLMQPETVDGVCEQAVEATRDVVGLDYVAVHLLQETDRLEPVAYTDDVLDLYDEPPSFAPGTGLQGTAFERGETVVVTDDTTGPFRDQDHPIQSAVVIPLGKYGVLGAASTDPVEVDDETVHFAEVLAASTTTAIARADREEMVREREQELERQNERLEEFAHVVSHDLRNPLTVASGHLEEIDADPDLVDPIDRSLDRMEAIIGDVLTLARHGEPVRDPDSIALDRAAHAAWNLTDTRDATLTVTGDATIRADESRLRQLFENLFRNSVEHGGRDASVTVEPITADEEVVGFAVADDGPGIAPGDQDEVFDSGYTTADEGTGLGLSIVHQVVEDHAWEISVTESETGGARFEVTGVDAAGTRQPTQQE